MGKIFKAVFLLGFFRFLRLSNIAPHSVAAFGPTRHITAGDLIFASKFMKIVLKWSKTNQNRDKAHLLSLPHLMGSNLCPYKACRAVIKLYSPHSNHPLFQLPRGTSWIPLTDIH